MGNENVSIKDLGSIVLCNKGNVTIKKYIDWEKAQKREEIANGLVLTHLVGHLSEARHPLLHWRMGHEDAHEAAPGDRVHDPQA